MIRINDVTKKYGGTVILEHCSYDFPTIGIVCLMGASGGGKTTLLNLLAGFDTDYSGEIIVGGMPINTMSADALCGYRRDNIGFVFQNYHLLPGYTVEDNILLATELSGALPETQKNKADELLKQLGMFEKKNQNAESLSGGQKQRVVIARALINDPQIIFADEPTGALDRATSTEIMKLLKGVSKERLVIVITHDPKICEFADEIIHIKDRNIVVEKPKLWYSTKNRSLILAGQTRVSRFARATKNFKVHAKRYAAASLAISIGILAFLFSLSFGNVMERSIEEFQEKNTAFNNGYIKGEDDGTIYPLLTNDDRIENVYKQYKIGEVSLSIGGKTEILAEKYPTSKAVESLSYGVMPRFGENEISITPSLAKKFDADIKNLLGKELTLEYEGKSYTVEISGIYNAGYDDFFVSSDIEQQFYANLSQQKIYSISYDVKEFANIVAVNNDLEMRGISAQTASKEVYALQNTFDSLSKLFFVVSILILAIGLFICAVLLIKLQNSRYHEVGLLSALGFSRQHITSILQSENLLLCSLATAVNLALLGLSLLVSNLFGFSLIVTGLQVVLSVIATFGVVLLLSGTASYKLVRTEPAVALRK